ncbi:MAG: hypothetical protein E3J87_08535 [Candidatus Cloacimonadota bacterium]|nr:MAG: hypothetical protein E3J87_08535 [Candidatus Cloacimonadota bacterium]
MHRCYLLIFSLILFLSTPSFPAFEAENVLLLPVSKTYTFIPKDYFLEKKFIFSTAASQLYSMPECNQIYIGLLNMFPFAHLGADISFFGSELYNETEIGISILKGTKNLVGIRIKVMKLGIKGYEPRLYWSDDLLFISQNEFFYFQSTYNNALSYGYRYDEEKPVSSFSSLFRIYPSAWNSFNIKITFSDFTGSNFEIGNGINLSNILSIGGGLDLGTRSISSSLLLSLATSDLTYSVSIHPELGLTHTVGLIYSRVREKRVSSKE